MDKKTLIIKKLEELKKIYLLNDDKKWNLRALSNAINSIKKYDKEIISGDDLKNNIKGIGEKISNRINEILQTGNLEELKNNVENNDNLENILLITGVGNVRAKKWFDLGYKNIDDIKNAITEGKIKTTHHIDLGIEYYYDFQKKIPRIEIDEIKILLNEIIKKIDKNMIFEICGSYRRGAFESSDIDVLISHPNYNVNLNKIIKELTEIKFIIGNLTSKGNTKFMGVCKLKNNNVARRIDIRVVDYNSFFTSLIYFTGSKDFNVFIRNKALEKNLSLNEYALTDLNDNSIKFLKYEKEIFDILNIEYIPPEKR